MLNKKIFILVLFLHTFIQLVQSNDQNEAASNMEVCVEKNGCNVNVVFTGIQNFVETFITNIVDEVVDVVMTPYSSPSNTKNDTNSREMTTTTSTSRFRELIGNDKKTTFSTTIMPTTATTTSFTDKPNIDTTSTTISSTLRVTTTDKPNIDTTSTTIPFTSIATTTDKLNIDTTSTTISSTPIATTITDYQQNSTDFLLYKTPNGLFIRPYHLKNASISAVYIKDAFNFSQILPEEEQYTYNYQFTSDCEKKIIYILKTSKTGKKVLDVMNYNEQNEFKRTHRVYKTFENAQSIASDWITERIYFLESNDTLSNSIKFTDKTFNNSTSLTYFNRVMSKILVHPKKEIIFFSDVEDFWYTFTSPNSIPKSLYLSKTLKLNISDFAIDYLLDKLYWITSQDENYSLYCADIVGSNQSINLTNVEPIENLSNDAKNLAVFNNTSYWTVHNKNKYVLYSKNGKDQAREKGILEQNRKQLSFFLSSNCSYSAENAEAATPKSTDQLGNPTNLLLYATKTEFFTLSYSEIDLNSTKIAIKDSSNFSEINQFDDKNADIKKITVNCENNNIYILKSIKGDNRKVLDVIHYNNNNEFERTHRVFNMFDNAESILYDWTTGKLYWNEQSLQVISIKQTNDHFKESTAIKYLEGKINEIFIHPKRDVIFFSDFNNLQYYSTSLSNIINSLEKPPTKLYPSEKNMNNFTIDYALDKLCWIKSQDINSTLYCSNIVGSNELINLQNITDIETFPRLAKNLVVFNNTFYFTAEENNKQILYFKNGNETAVEVDKLDLADQLSFFSSNCPN